MTIDLSLATVLNDHHDNDNDQGLTSDQLMMCPAIMDAKCQTMLLRLEARRQYWIAYHHAKLSAPPGSPPPTDEAAAAMALAAIAPSIAAIMAAKAHADAVIVTYAPAAIAAAAPGLDAALWARMLALSHSDQ